jgi:polysaccharide pyruvyl transferase WcaK-like protein
VRKKIAIFGSYNSSSIGDTAILVGLIASLVRVFGETISIKVLVAKKLNIDAELKQLNIGAKVSEHVIFDRSPDSGSFTEKISRISHRVVRKISGSSVVKKNKTKSLLRDSDILLIGGGNLIMDLYPAWPLILRDVCESAKKANIPYGFAGIGAGPIQNEPGKSIFTRCLNEAEFVSFRDEHSKRLCEEVLGFSKSMVGPDLALGISLPENVFSNIRDSVFVNVAAVYSERWPIKDVSKFELYIENICELLILLLQKTNIKHIFLFNTNYPLDDLASLKLMGLLGEKRLGFKVHYLEGKRSVGELLGFLSRAKLALVTRLHAGILAELAGSDLVAVSYQPKVEDVLSAYFPGARIVNIDKLLLGQFDDLDDFYLREDTIEVRARNFKMVDALIERTL